MASKVSAVITHYFDERVLNLNRIIGDLLASEEPPFEIIIWNNGEPYLGERIGQFQHLHVIDSPRNIGCKARFFAAATALGDHVMFLDNDATVQHGTTAYMRHTLESLHPSIITMHGYVIEPGSRYEERRTVRSPSCMMPVTVGLGRCEMLDRRVLAQLMVGVPIFDDELAMDDLWLSVQARKAGIPIFVPKTAAGCDMDDLPTHNVGASLGARKMWHYDERGRLYDVLFNEGGG